MECYLVYEFIYHNFDEDIEENIEFFGLYKSKRDAVKKAMERIDYGIEKYDVVLSPEDYNKKKRIFSKNDSVEMYRDDDEFETSIYSIRIKKLKMKGSKKI